MHPTQLTSYDEVPYEGRPCCYTHPDTLAAVARLYGLTSAPPERCRVLELGCGTGHNLIAMARRFPASDFVGVDLSPTQIAAGAEAIGKLGLANIEIMAGSILDVDARLGRFDYIVCHGVYSWVPPAVQDKILQIARNLLAPLGVAYVSYNTYPGWHLKELLRGMLCFRTYRQHEPARRLAESRAFMDLLAASFDGSTEPYGQVLRRQVNTLVPRPDYYYFHEFLEDINAPLYFHEFAARAAGTGLQYLDEAEPDPIPSSVPAEVIRALGQLSADRIEREQYFDFVRGRAFRKTLLCHSEVAIPQWPSADALRTLHLTSHARPIAKTPELSSEKAEGFHMPDGRSVTSNDPVFKSALAVLIESRPQRLHFEQLWERVESILPGIGTPSTEQENARRRLAASLLRVYQAGFVRLYAHQSSTALVRDPTDILPDVAPDFGAARVSPMDKGIAAECCSQTILSK